MEYLGQWASFSPTGMVKGGCMGSRGGSAGCLLLILHTSPSHVGGPTCLRFLA